MFSGVTANPMMSLECYSLELQEKELHDFKILVTFTYFFKVTAKLKPTNSSLHAIS